MVQVYPVEKKCTLLESKQLFNRGHEMTSINTYHKWAQEDKKRTCKKYEKGKFKSKSILIVDRNTIVYAEDEIKLSLYDDTFNATVKVKKVSHLEVVHTSISTRFYLDNKLLKSSFYDTSVKNQSDNLATFAKKYGLSEFRFMKKYGKRSGKYKVIHLCNK